MNYLMTVLGFGIVPVLVCLCLYDILILCFISRSSTYRLVAYGSSLSKISNGDGGRERDRERERKRERESA